MNNVYLYDGSFNNLMILIFMLIKNNKEPFDIKSINNYEPNLIDKYKYLKFNNITEKLKYVYKTLDSIVLIRIYYTYLSDNKNKEMIIYNFIKNALIYKNIFFRRNIESVNDVLKISQYVSRENHKMKGFLRFKKMKSYYYAKMSPTNNILPLTVNHFKRRMQNECWIIYDEKRKIYGVYDLKNVVFYNENQIINLNLDIDDSNELFEELWKTFFETIAIKQRLNKKAQMNFMPKKYWNNMIEMEDKI